MITPCNVYDILSLLTAMTMNVCFLLRLVTQDDVMAM